MARPKVPAPKISRQRKGKQDRAVVYFADPITGTKRMKVLGDWGAPEVQTRYRQFLAELGAGHVPSAAAKPEPLTVQQLAILFLTHAKTYYLDTEGKSTSEYIAHTSAIAVLIEVCGTTPAAEFGTRLLDLVRTKMIERGWTRQHVNAQVRRYRPIVECLDCPRPGKYKGCGATPGANRGAEGQAMAESPEAEHEPAKGIKAKTGGQVQHPELRSCHQAGLHGSGNRSLDAEPTPSHGGDGTAEAIRRGGREGAARARLPQHDGDIRGGGQGEGVRGDA